MNKPEVLPVLKIQWGVGGVGQEKARPQLGDGYAGSLNSSYTARQRVLGSKQITKATRSIPTVHEWAKGLGTHCKCGLHVFMANNQENKEHLSEHPPGQVTQDQWAFTNPDTWYNLNVQRVRPHQKGKKQNKTPNQVSEICFHHSVEQEHSGVEKHICLRHLSCHKQHSRMGWFGGTKRWP